MSEFEFWDELGNIFNAIVAYQQKTIEFNKRFVNPWLRLGTVFDQNDHNAETLLASKKALEIDQDSPTNWLALGDVYFKMGALDDAAGAYSKAIELNPKLGWAYANLALIATTRQRYTEAINLYVRSLELIVEDKDRAMIWNRLGNTYRKVNDYENAFIAFQMADESDGQNTGFEDNLDEVTVEQRVMPIVAEVYVNDNNAVRLAPVEESAAESTEEESVATPVASNESETLATASEPVADLTEATQVAPAVEATETSDTVTAPEAVAEETQVTVSAEPEALIIEEIVAQLQQEEQAPVAVETADVQEAQSDVAALDQAVETESAGGVVEAANPVVEEAVEQVEVEVAVISDDVTEVAEAELQLEPANAIVEETIAEQAVEADEEPAFDNTADVTMTPVSTLMVETFADPSLLNQPIVLAVEDLTELLAAAPVATEAPAEETATEETEANTEPQYESVDEAELAEIANDQLVTEDATNANPTVEASASAEEVEAQEVAVETIVAETVQTSDDQEAAYDEYRKDSAEPTLTTAAEPIADSPKTDLAVEPDTRNAHVWNELGNVYFNTGSYEEAVTAYSKAIELDDWFAWPYSNLALVYVQKEKYAEAILLYQRSIELFASDKDKAITWNRLGNVYRRLNDYDNAIVCYQRADELDPNNATRSLRSRFSLLGNLSLEQAQSLAV